MEPSEFEAVLEATRRFVHERVMPIENQIDETDEIPPEVRSLAAEMGLFGFALPVDHGGLGLSMSEEARLVFELGYTTPALRSMFGTNNGIAGHVLIEAGTEEQKKKWLPRLASGEVVASFALTEPEAGSDPAMLTTSARREGADWVINGAKRYITNAPVASLFLVFARTAASEENRRSISVFLVPGGSRGLAVGPRDHKMGQQGAWTADVTFDEVRVPADALVGEEGTGYRTAMRCLAHGRLHIAALCVGLAQRLVDESVGYSLSRRQSGHPIAEFQLVQGMLADSATELYAGRSMVMAAAADWDSGRDRHLGPPVCKYFCAEMVGRVADRAVQIHGGSGYMRGVAVERFYRDARLFRIYEGTSQVQQVLIARHLLAAHTESQNGERA
jgi:acyl-CoA dehydrogenase